MPLDLSFELLAITGLIFGIGFGVCTQRSGLCYAHGLGEIFVGRGKRITRIFLIMLIITSIGFLLSGYYSSDLGLKAVGQIRGYGFYNILAGIFFGAGILLNGGCILGTLRQIGEGNMTFVLILLSFIPGMALVVFAINPVLDTYYNTACGTGALLPDILGISAPYIVLALVIGSCIWLLSIRNKRS
jgi:Na+/serine symporter